MQVTQEQIDPCKIALTITVEPETVKAAEEKAFRNLANNLALPGFRKGKVPPHMARPYIDPGRIRERAAEQMWEPAYKEAVVETQVEPFAQPELEFVSFDDNGFTFKALVPTRPVVTLGPYKGLAAERRRLKVADEDVEKQIEEVRSRQAEFPEITDRGAQTGDVALADLAATVDGEALEGFSEARSTVIEIGKNIADFDNGLVGMTVGETKTIDALYPEDFNDENLRGKRATFTVTIRELREKKLPELNDEFAQKVSQTAKTPDELRAEIRGALEKAAVEMAENDLEFRLIGEIVKNSQIFFPEVLLRAEINAEAQQLEERLKRENLTVEQWLEQNNTTVEIVQQQLALSAAQRIRNSLALSEVARTEQIVVEDADVDAEIADRAERAKVSAAAVRAYAERNDQLNQFRDQALTKKILRFLKDSANITEKELTSEEMESLEAEEEQRLAAEATAAIAENTSGETPLEAAEAAAADPEAASSLAVEEAAPKKRAPRAKKAKADEPAAAEETPAA